MLDLDGLVIVGGRLEIRDVHCRPELRFERHLEGSDLERHAPSLA